MPGTGESRGRPGVSSLSCPQHHNPTNPQFIDRPLRAIMDSMLQLSVRLVHADQVDTLRSWFIEVQTTRRAEAVATLVDETVDQETAILVEVGDQHLLVYAMDVQDSDQARRSAHSGKHPIDADHHRILERVLAGIPTHETVLDISP